MSSRERIRCRPIGTSDLGSVAALLARGFPSRPLDYWTRGLERLARRPVPEGLPRFGFLLEHEGTPVGAILTIAQTVTHAGDAFVRCNLASWYVDPAFRSQAAMLSVVPLRHRSATYLNVSAAPNTWPTIEAQGFRRYTFGQRLAVPALGRGGRGLRVKPFVPGRTANLPEAQLLIDHAANGCLALVGEGPEGPVPFVLMPYRAKQGRFWLPVMQLVFCRGLEDVERFAVPLGRTLIRHGAPFLLFDDTAERPCGMPGLFLDNRARKYVRGEHEPRLGDLAYTEFTIFGA